MDQWDIGLFFFGIMGYIACQLHRTNPYMSGCIP